MSRFGDVPGDYIMLVIGISELLAAVILRFVVKVLPGWSIGLTKTQYCIGEAGFFLCAQGTNFLAFESPLWYYKYDMFSTFSF